MNKTTTRNTHKKNTGANLKKKKKKTQQKTEKRTHKTVSLYPIADAQFESTRVAPLFLILDCITMLPMYEGNIKCERMAATAAASATMLEQRPMLLSDSALSIQRMRFN